MEDTERKPDSSIPTVSYSAPGYKFAKLFTETSLDEIKETVRKRLALSSVSKFTLFYDIDDEKNFILENDSDFAVLKLLSHPPASALHVLVEILSPLHAPYRNVADRRPISLPSISPRLELVSYLYEIVEEQRFFLVHGTSGSGKTILCSLLYNHILGKNPNDLVSCVGPWQQRHHVWDSLSASCIRGDILDPSKDWQNTRTCHWILIDEAQTTYKDHDFWLFLKDISHRFLIVLFASYCRPFPTELPDVVGTQNHILGWEQMCLRPTQNGRVHRRYIPGLYLTRPEFDELIAQESKKSALSIDLADWIYQASKGHIGAIDSVLCVMKAVDKTRPPEISLPEFLASVSGAEAVLKECAHGRAFVDRGFPEEAALKMPENAKAVQFVRGLLESVPQSLTSYELPEGARQAHELGWVTLEDDHEVTLTAEFPSLFHQSRLSYLLNGSLGFPAGAGCMELAKFILKIISSPELDAEQASLNLGGEEKVGS